MTGMINSYETINIIFSYSLWATNVMFAINTKMILIEGIR